MSILTLAATKSDTALTWVVVAIAVLLFVVIFVISVHAVRSEGEKTKPRKRAFSDIFNP